MHSFTKKLREGNSLVGTVLSLGASAVSEVVSHCGFDWLWIDMEHAPLSLEQVQTMLQAKSDQCHAFVRIPTADETWIKRVLDLGPDGVIVPNVKTADQARMVVAACKYPPAGVRSVGLSRASKFGLNFADYVRDANEQTVVILQIEHTEAVQEIDSILMVPNIDAIIIGPYDLSGSFGKLGQVEDPEVQAAMRVVQDACKKHSVPLGVFAMTPEHARNYLQQGYKLVAVGIDINYLWTSAKNALESLKVKKANPTQPASVRS